MNSLSNEQKQLLFDYCVGLTSERETAEAEALISSNKKAAEINSILKAAFSPLESLKDESCPDDLAESTVLRLNDVARSSQLRLQQLLAAEQTQPVTAKIGYWRNWGEMIAAAAVIMLIVGVLFPSLSFFHQLSRDHRCQMQLWRIGQGIERYSSDHDGKMPAVATATGAPWWKVGYPGPENHSNTRHIWLLVKGDYADLAHFVCPCRKRPVVIKFDRSQAKKYNDFPDRTFITYSLRIMCGEAATQGLDGRRVLMADLNPLFEQLPKDYSKPFKLKLSEELFTVNSVNHGGRGQNVLFGDGSTKFLKTRHTDITQDDIFTLQEMTPGSEIQGCEVPSCETDTLVAP